MLGRRPEGAHLRQGDPLPPSTVPRQLGRSKRWIARERRPSSRPEPCLGSCSESARGFLKAWSRSTDASRAGFQGTSRRGGPPTQQSPPSSGLARRGRGDIVLPLVQMSHCSWLPRGTTIYLSPLTDAS